MLNIRRAEDRGHYRNEWLNSYHTFSFGEYHDSRFMGFRNLRVINEDRVIPGGGFDTHGHRDMEIISYIIEGSLRHQDSLGSGSIIQQGEVQRMTAGKGIRHSEFNASEKEGVHFLQIWITPETTGLEPGYSQQPIDKRIEQGNLTLIASGNAETDGLILNANAQIYAGILEQDAVVTHEFIDYSYGWLQVVSGNVSVEDETLTAGDGVAISGQNLLKMKAIDQAEVVLFELP